MLRAFALVFTLASVPASADSWNTPESRARWAELTKAIYGADAKLEAVPGLVTIEAPPAAQDAALVPVAIRTAADAHVTALDLVIDQNPSPLAAKIAFGPAGDPRLLKLRVRVDGFTNAHAVATTADGKRSQTVTYVQASGGCSAPVSAGADEATASMGEMRMKFSTNAALGDAPQATLMIRHPNFNGMQMNQTTHAYVPSRYIKSIAVTRGGKAVLTMQTDISLSTNPVIEFLYKPDGNAPFQVTVVDTANATWTKQFDARQAAN